MKSEGLPDKMRRRFLKLCEKRGITEDVGVKEAICYWICIQEVNEANNR